MGSPNGSCSVVPDIGVNLALSLIIVMSSLRTRSDLLKRNRRGICLRVRSNGGGRSSLNKLLRHPEWLLVDARQRLVLPCPQLGIHFLIKFSCHLCKTRYRYQTHTKLSMPIPKTYFFLLWLLLIRHKKKAQDPENDEPRFEGQSVCQSLQWSSHSSKSPQHNLYTCSSILDET